MSTYKEWAERLYPILVERAVAGDTPMSYKEAADACGFNSWRGMGSVLEEVYKLTCWYGEPQLTVFVVLKYTGVPGVGNEQDPVECASLRRAAHAYFASRAADALNRKRRA